METPQPRKATWRMGPRERQRIQFGAVVIICILMWVCAIGPYLNNVREIRDFQTCQTHVLKISRAITLYSQEWDDTMPNASTWADSAAANLAVASTSGYKTQDYFRCPLDKSTSESSYAYNELFSGLSLTVRKVGSASEAQRTLLGRPERAPLLIEKHGVAWNARVRLPDWDTVAREMTRPHNVPDPTGLLIMGNLSPGTRTNEQMANLAGKKFR